MDALNAQTLISSCKGALLNQLGIFVSVTVAVLWFHILYSMSYWSKTHSPDQQICHWLIKPTTTPASHFSVWRKEFFNPLTPNDHYSGRTAPLTSKRCILYIYSTNTGTEYFKHGIYSPFFFSSKCSLFHNSNVFGSCFIHILYTGCARIEKNNSDVKRLTTKHLKVLYINGQLIALFIIFFYISHIVFHI